MTSEFSRINDVIVIRASYSSSIAVSLKRTKLLMLADQLSNLGEDKALSFVPSEILARMLLISA
jgi:hypothetical protein